VSASQGISGVNRTVTSLAEKGIVGSTVPTCPFRYAAVACSCRFGPNSLCRVLCCTHHTQTKFEANTKRELLCWFWLQGREYNDYYFDEKGVVSVEGDPQEALLHSI